MKKFLSILILTALPLVALAQTGPNVPVIIVDQGSQLGVQADPAIANKPVLGRTLASFPDIAVTRVGENTTGQHVDAPPAPGANLAPAAAPAAPTAVTPASPMSPSSAVSKLWPRDTIALFMPSCVGYYPQFGQPCMCVITQMMSTMPHDEFLRESEAGTIETDPRLIKIRTDCASAPKKQ